MAGSVGVRISATNASNTTPAANAPSSPIKPSCQGLAGRLRLRNREKALPGSVMDRRERVGLRDDLIL